MKDIEAKPVIIDDKYRIEVRVDGEKIFLGKSLDGADILFKFTEYDTEKEATDHISKSDRLFYNQETK